MKRMIVNTYEDLTPIRRFTVDIVFEMNSDVAASSILPLQNPDGSYDEIALSEYDSFIIEALEIFSHHGLEVLEERESPQSKPVYYSFVDADELGSDDYKYILFVRISDHANRRKTRAQKMKFYDAHAQELKRPATKSKQVWRLKEITVNGQIFDSYEDALEALDKQLSTYRK